MASIELGIASSHAPQLATPPEEWGQRAVADRKNQALIYKGKQYNFDELNELRGAAFGDEIAPDVWAERYARARAGIEKLGKIVRDAKIDVLVIVSSDHKETFDDQVLSPFVIYWGDEVAHVPFTEEAIAKFAPGLAIAEVKNVPEVATTRKTDGELAQHLIEGIQNEGFDPSASKNLPAGRYGDYGIPHGWGYIIQQVLRGEDIPPIVPIFVNTFWHPNPPTAKRSYDFGVALGKALQSYPKDIRVGLVASGGLSHFVIDEEMDLEFLQALKDKDAATITKYSNDVLRSGTSELRNWMVVAGALAGSKLQAEVIDYIPAYRSEAGTGAGLGFVAWQ
jgi:3-O-methylgallate 3,4-dioxygenase